MEDTEKIKILILDDEKQLTEELIGFFQGTEYKSFEANTAEEGYKTLLNNEIDLLILDVRLPGVNGLDILKDVKF
jgi:DNA-binding response OmpR family regulator